MQAQNFFKDEAARLAQSSDEGEIAVSHGAMRSKFVIGAVVSATLLLGAIGMVALQPRQAAVTASPGSFEQLAEIAAAQPLWQINTVERDMCSKSTENCLYSRCCKTTGYRCFKQSETLAKCAKECKGSSCEVLSRSNVIFQDTKPAKSLFCFALYTANTGSTKKSYEKEILTEAFSRKWHIFACDAYEVYSDVTVSLGDGFNTKALHDVDNTFHFAKRKETGAWVNTGMFQQAWKAIGQAQTYKSYDWTVKVDADAVFFPSRLVKRIEFMPRATTGVFLTNCQSVDNGFFGSLEVFSEVAFSSLVANVDNCNNTLPWTIGVKGGEYGPMGEDLFAEKCLEKNGAMKIEAFDIKVDGACPANRPKDQAKNKKWKPNCAQTVTPAMHPFKKTAEWVKCYKESTAAEVTTV